MRHARPSSTVGQVGQAGKQGFELRLTTSKKCVAHASFDRDGFRIRARETAELHVPRVSGTRGSTSKTHSTLTGALLLTWIRCPGKSPGSLQGNRVKVSGGD